MITIEIKGRDVEIQKKRVKKIIDLLPKNSYFHFLFEPELIIRIKNKNRHYIVDYLKKKKLAYKIYAYPFPKNGRFGESKKSVMYKYQDEFKKILHQGSLLALKRKKKDSLFIIERYNHTFLNAMGYEWIDESIIYAWLTKGRINVIKKYEKLIPLELLICSIIMMLTSFNIKLMKFIK